MTLLSLLREATRASHATLDAGLSTKKIAGNPAAYTDYLVRFQNGLQGCWPMLDWHAFAQLGLPDIPRRQERYRSLSADLQALGRKEPKWEDATGTDVGRAVGCLYVLEGSIHGGGMIHAALERSGSEIPVSARNFLRGFGPDNGLLWKNFTDWLETLPHPGPATDGAETGAVRAFQIFTRAFSH